MLLQDLKRVFSRLGFSQDRLDFGDWGKFAEPEEVLDFVNHLND